MDLYLFDTLTRTKRKFIPLHSQTGFYACGPTVYNYAHLGNLRTYIFEDILKRTLLVNNFKVNHVMNITDVGHLTSDADSGEDKMEKGAKREGKTVWQIAEFYTKAFKQDLKKLDILAPNKWTKATSHIKEQIALVKLLEQKGFTYRLDDGVYFDTSRLPDYGKLARLNIAGLKSGARVEMVSGKRNLTDFALWKLSPSTGSGSKRQMEWDSPWGVGFPGWHLECSAMAIKYLGQPFYIHTGGVDHIPVHHTNEIAQSETAVGKPLARFWLHGEFLIINEGRMGKSEGNFITLKTLIDKGYDPLSYRYLCLTAHYRSKLNFTWESLAAAEQGFHKLCDTVSSWKNVIASVAEQSRTRSPRPAVGGTRDDRVSPARFSRFLQLLNDDLNTPKALAYTFDLLKEKPSPELLATVLAMDQVFGLNLPKLKPLKIPVAVRRLTVSREQARKFRDWAKADVLRQKLQQKGFQIEDTPSGPLIKKI